VVTNLVYDAFGQLVAEYNSTPVQTAGGVTYLASDHQGSTRIMMDKDGVVIGRRDYQPFGEEIPTSIGRRTTAQGYAANLNTRQQYAGMEKELSGLNHTNWRAQESLAGRWTSPDPYGGSMRIANPQSFNRYSYASNDPINRIDPSGLDDRPNIGTFNAGNIYAGPDPATTLPVMIGSNIVMRRPLIPQDTRRRLTPNQVRTVRDKLKEFLTDKCKDFINKLVRYIKGSAYDSGKQLLDDYDKVEKQNGFFFGPVASAGGAIDHQNASVTIGDNLSSLKGYAPVYAAYTALHELIHVLVNRGDPDLARDVHDAGLKT
jgi:RHS repeat-associated protein